VIRAYQAAHGGTVFYETPTRRQKHVRTRLAAILVIVAVAGSAGLLQRFGSNATGFESGALERSAFSDVAQQR